MPNLKTLTKELRQEIVSYLYPLPSISSNLAFRLAIQIFAKTRFSSHINFISRCLQHKVIPKGFRLNFHASIFSSVSNFNLKYLHEIQRTQNTFSHNIMRSTIRAMCSKRNEPNKQIMSLSTFKCTSFCFTRVSRGFTTIYSHQNPSSQL